MQTDKIESLRKRASNALASINVLFELPGSEERRIIDIDSAAFLEQLRAILKAIISDLDSVYSNPSICLRFSERLGDAPDAVDFINAAATGGHFDTRLTAAIMDLAAMDPDFFNKLNSTRETERQAARFKLAHAHRLCSSCATLIPDYLNFLEMSGGNDDILGRPFPAAYRLTCKVNTFKLPEKRLSAARIATLNSIAADADPFRTGRSFRYSAPSFSHVTLNSIRPVSAFYGYESVKETFRKHFLAFAKGQDNLPLLITSMPGLGKTHFSIAYTLAFPQLTLILPEPEDLGPRLPELIARLEKRRTHKFVVFFDDVDTRNIDWYYFRTHVGGSFILPDNICVVIASNFRFPPNISSRGREVCFPLFDEESCKGMILDYLRGLKMRNPSPELISVLTADYQEAYGQKIYPELSPRSLVRYLDTYDRNPDKRRRMLEFSRQSLITRPDPQLFHDFNVRAIKALYGEEGLEELRNRILSAKD